MGKGWWRPGRVAKHLDVSKDYVYSLVRRGELDGAKDGTVLRISLESLEAFLERKRIKVDEG